MANRKSTAVGGFILGGLAIGVAAILLFGGARLFTTNLRAVVFFSDSVAGLSVGAPVTLRGVRVGTVRAMKIDVRLPEIVPVIPVTIELERDQLSWTRGAAGLGAADLTLAIQAGLRAQLATQSLVTGQLAVELDFHPDSPATLVGGGGLPEIPSIPSDLTRLKNQIADLNLPALADNAGLVLNGLLRIIGELDGKAGPLADSLRLTSDSARVTLESTTALVNQLKIETSQTLDKIDRLAGAGDAWITALRGDTSQLLAEANRTVAAADRLIGSLRDMTGPRAEMRGDLEAMLRDLAASASSLRDFTRALQRNPGGTLLKRTP